MNGKTSKLLQKNSQENLNFYLKTQKGSSKKKIDQPRTLKRIKKRLKKEWNQTDRKKRNKLRKILEKENNYEPNR